jgi:hypothetical protein
VAAKTNIGISAKSNPSITPERARDARARAWRFVFDCWEQRKTIAKYGGEEYVRKEKRVTQKRTIT